MFEGSTRNTSSMAIKMLSRAAVKGGDGQCLRAQLPYIRSDLPILVVFRALGFVVSSLLPCCCRILINGLHQTVDTGLGEPGSQCCAVSTRLNLAECCGWCGDCHASTKAAHWIPSAATMLTSGSMQHSTALCSLTCHNQPHSSAGQSQPKGSPPHTSCEGSPASPD